jgi:hypothetical protein
MVRVALFVLAFAVLGLLLGIAETYDGRDLRAVPLGDELGNRNPEVQSKLFDQCIEQASVDGDLTDDEYNACAYSIYD